MYSRGYSIKQHDKEWLFDAGKSVYQISSRGKGV